VNLIADGSKAFPEITVIPNGIDQHYFQPYTGVRQSMTLVFSGKMSYHANVAGALALAECILPLIWRRQPDVRLVIAGADPPQTIRRLARDRRIIVTGYVPDIRPHIAQAHIAVSPLPYAVGIQNKILEAMALGTPVIASSSAAVGLQTVAGHDLLVADTPEAFAAATLQLLGDQGLWNRLAENAIHYIRVHHDWEEIMGRLIAVYDRLRWQSEREVGAGLSDKKG
jgi:glycosyltransferase involved in cell wall biosynthesis